MCSVSDKAMTMILDLLRDAFEQAKLPKTVYEAKKTIRKLGIEYAKIDARPNDCMLYRGDDANLTRCKKCGCSRWKQKTKKGSILRLNVPVKRNGKLIAAKTLRYFPLIPRMQRLFMCSKTSSDMLWHKQASNNDGFLRHPRDAEAWKKFDAKYTNFSADPRNVRLALASDGFNPFGNMSTKYSIWPVILIPYNLPPWICMKQTSFILSTLIPGPKIPGNNIDVYLQPLIDELKQLWDGVETYDAKEGNTFKMYAALMWTISDFPGLGNLFGWNTHSGSNVEIRQRLSETDVLRQQSNVHFSFGKSSSVTSKKRRNGQDTDEDDSHWKKKSVFFDLLYWKDQMLRHNLDVMHIEKNVCDNVVFTILNDSSKSMDNLKARRDLQCMGIRPELWPEEGDSYSSNVACCVDLRQRKLYGLKSHDCHILMEQLLPILVTFSLPSPVSNVIANLSSFFRELCGKAINLMQLAELQNHVVQILCQMEIIFPPSFFTIMVHLTMHLVDEVTLGGLVHYRWMYPIERYLDNIETRINRPGRVDDGPVDVPHNSGESIFPAIGKALGAVSHFELTPMEKHQAHRHVLVNCDAVVPFLE
ncbi:uncharacterized protein LOC130983294 [Arachis stenosperma]|uniref:uncharacterized protein LOC130983294 n=1 Tax=Arachis stenosperma TaxID=217475 RepID=UPI0025AB90A7|nr:uncharacterized protein LOC130983294 [Arachis stenosperma]